MMGKKKSGKFKKTQKEAQKYRDFLANSSFSPEDTVPVQNEMLQGSMEYDIEDEKINSSEKIRKTPFKYRVGDWFKKNIFPTIITTVIIAIGSAVVAHQVNLAVINKQIEYIEKRIEQIDTDFVEKDVLDLELKQIISDIDSSYSLTFNDIKWQLKEIEEKINSLS